MFTLRCTAKMLSGFQGKVERDPPRSDTLLGDWYANVLVWRRQRLVLFVAERTLLPVVVPADEAESLPGRLVLAVDLALSRLSIPVSSIDGELARMVDMTVARTASRQVLGSMNDFAHLVEGNLDMGVPLTELSSELAKAPCRPIGMASPARATQDLFAGQSPS